jgi:hypothetical protein
VHSLRALKSEELNIFQRILGENVQITLPELNRAETTGFEGPNEEKLRAKEKILWGSGINALAAGNIYKRSVASS